MGCKRIDFTPVIRIQTVEQVQMGILPIGHPTTLSAIKCPAYGG